MTIHEFGSENSEIIILIHPSIVRWDYFEYVIPLLKDEYHLIIPAVDGYDIDSDRDFVSVEKCASDISEWMISKNYASVTAAYGCSMGGSVVSCLTAENKLHIDHAVMDGGIMPYQLPYLFTRVILLRDFAVVASGKAGGEKLLLKAFTDDEYSREDISYISDVLRRASYKTLWNTFDSCNNYYLPEQKNTSCRMHYWYAENEIMQRDWDIRFIKWYYPDIDITRVPGLGHGGLALKKPELFAQMLKDTIRN